MSRIRWLVFDALSAYFFASVLAILLTPVSMSGQGYAAEAPVALLAISSLLFFIVLTILRKRVSMQGWTLFGSSLLYGFMTVFEAGSAGFSYYTVTAAVLLALLFWYLQREGLLPFPYELAERRTVALIAAAAVGVAVLIGWSTVIRYESYSSSTFDFGIFAQMYESMATTGQPLTTVERNELMSHFSVHFSPIYYILLPFYMLFRTPAFLPAAQIAVVVSGVIPVYLLAKHLRFGEGMKLAWSMIYLTLPAFITPCFYDFHENLFLPPLLLWLLYFCEREKRVAAVGVAVLLLLVKEDAGIYLVAVGLYLLLARGRYPWGSILVGLGVVGFVVSVSIVHAIGGETLATSHYLNLIPAGHPGGLSGILRTVLVNPAYVLTQVLSAEKLTFLLQMLLPLGLFPLLGRRLMDLVLLFPVVAINLMTNYGYQYDVGYQYVFGTGALLVFLAMKHASEWKPGTARNTLTLLAVLSSLFMCFSLNARNVESIATSYSARKEAAAETTALLESIPKDASVAVSTFLMPHLYAHPEVYMYPSVYRADMPETEYAVFDLRAGYFSEYDDAIAYYTERGYELVETRGFAELYRKGG